MGWRRRTRSRTKCSRKAYIRAHDQGTVAFAAYLKACGKPLGRAKRRR
jgi:hypothetical protein